MLRHSQWVPQEYDKEDTFRTPLFEGSDIPTAHTYKQTDRQTDKQTDSNILPTPTESWRETLQREAQKLKAI